MVPVLGFSGSSQSALGVGVSSTGSVPRAPNWMPRVSRTRIMADFSRLRRPWGVPVSEIQRGIKHGVRKINIDTDNRMALTGQIRRVLSENPGEFDPRKYLKPARDAMQKLCVERLEAFNTAGQASKIKKIVTLADMAKRYQTGELDPKIA